MKDDHCSKVLSAVNQQDHARAPNLMRLLTSHANRYYSVKKLPHSRGGGRVEREYTDDCTCRHGMKVTVCYCTCHLSRP